MPETFSLFTATGKLTAYAFQCGYVETDKETGLAIWWQHCSYHVGGWLNPDSLSEAIHIRKACRSLTEARKVARKPHG